MGQNILIAVDLQNDFIGGALGTKEAKVVVPRAAERIRRFPGTVIFTTHSVGNANACPGDTVIHLLDSAGNQLLQDDDSGVFPCSKIAKAVPAGNVYLWVQRFSDTQTIPAYQLDYTLQ